MNTKNFTKLINKDNLATKFIFDELGMTWQISFTRIVGGTKEIYESPEHFFLSLIKAVEMHTDLTYGLSNWQFEVDLKEWCNGLKIEKIDISTFERDLKGALDEIEEYKDDWTGENEPRFNKHNVIKPNGLMNYWKIEETINPRMPVGPTYGYLAEFKESYFYIEYHLES
ncbi:hypothetical protein BTO06_01195 [Tenacibaculum sp. SZ-18]|uniref:hypothetical protein n=1 Tax=Tenacibaculum sp. SZ-18 TaxID=754423 RepID=UPI000C2CEF2D|nr:hypothetical protein [Tenacibaculum sp. SZ-18]AUC13850.1 hypothetical protein BTO06_01195 [Tenacibaculum sp. SZ-18]